MAWDDAPPTEEELAPTQAWDQSPPPEQVPQEQKPIKQWEDMSLGEKAAEFGASSIAPSTAIGAGILGAASPVPGGAYAGAGFGYAGGKELEKIVRHYLMNQPQEPSTAFDVGMNVGMGAAQELGAAAIGVAGSKAAPYVKGPLKDAAEKILAAAERLGIKPTRSMLEESPELARKEAQLAKSGTFSGEPVKTQREQVMDVLGQQTEQAAKNIEHFTEAGSVSPSTYGRAAKEALSEEATLARDIAQRPYTEITPHLQNIPVNDRTKVRISKEILDMTSKATDPAKTKAKNVVKDIMGSKSVEDIRSLVSQMRDLARDKMASEPSLSRKYSLIADKLESTIESSIMKGSVDLMENLLWNFEAKKALPQGIELGSDVISALRGANKGWASYIENLSGLTEKAQMGPTSSLKGFLKKLGKVPDEKIVETLFRPENASMLRLLKKEYAPAFDILQRGYMTSLREGATSGGVFNPLKFIQSLNRVSDEGIGLLFGKEAQTMLDAKYIAKSLPEGFVSPADTGFLSYLKEIPAATAKLLYENPKMAGAIAAFRRAQKPETASINELLQFSLKDLPRRVPPAVGTTILNTIMGSQNQKNQQMMSPIEGPQTSIQQPRPMTISDMAAQTGQNPEIILQQYKTQIQDSNLTNMEKARKLKALSKGNIS